MNGLSPPPRALLKTSKSPRTFPTRPSSHPSHSTTLCARRHSSLSLSPLNQSWLCFARTSAVARGGTGTSGEGGCEGGFVWETDGGFVWEGDGGWRDAEPGLGKGCVYNAFKPGCPFTVLGWTPGPSSEMIWRNKSASAEVGSFARKVGRCAHCHNGRTHVDSQSIMHV